MATNVPTVNTAAYAIKEAFEFLGGIQKKPAIAAWVNEHYPDRWDDKTIRGNLYGCCVNNPTGIRNHRSFPRFLYYRGVAEYELYDASKHGFFDPLGYPEGQGPDEINETLNTVNDEFESPPVGSAEFAYEAHLRDYLAKNLHLLEAGLSLWSEDAIEFPLGNRRVDILARDSNGNPVVIELKLKQGHEKVIGQALLYRAKIKSLLGVSKVRIMLVAAGISDDLRIASSEVTDVQLFEYQLAMQIKSVSNMSEGINKEN